MTVFHDYIMREEGRCVCRSCNKAFGCSICLLQPVNSGLYENKEVSDLDRLFWCPAMNCFSLLIISEEYGIIPI